MREKRQRGLRYLLGVLLLCCAFVLPGTAWAAKFDATMTAKTTGELNMRSSAKVASNNKLTKIPKGKIVDILADAGNGWYKVTFKDQTGYVSGKYLTENTDLVTPTAPLHVRSSVKIDTEENILTTIPKGTKVPVISRYTNGWYKVKYAGKTGYVNGKYLNDPRLKKVAQWATTGRVNLRSSKRTDIKTNIMLTLPKNAVVEVVAEEKGGWTKITYKKKVGYLRTKYLKKVSAQSNTSEQTVTVKTKTTKGVLRLRSSKRTDIKTNILLKIPKGDKVEVVTTYKSGWVKVKYDGKTGYVDGRYLK